MSNLRRVGARDAPLGHCPNCLLNLSACVPPVAGEPVRFGDYELLEVLGRGGMGVVYAARQASLKRRVALKMLHPECSAFHGFAQRLRLEAEAAPA